MLLFRRSLALGALLTVMAFGLHKPDPVGAQTLTEDQLTAFNYRSIGPTRQSGRFVDFAVPLQQPGTFYAAAGSGHLWKTENHGLSWEVLFENEAVYSIGDITVAPSDPDILYLGSGEANNSRSTYWGDGVYKSTDAGATWTNVGLPESHHIGRIVVHPTDPNLVYVAALGHLYSENPERGLYKSTNGGRTWDQILAPEVRGKTIGVVDVAMDPSNPEVLYAATFDKVRVPWSYDLAGPGSRVYKTTDGGDNWEMLTNGLPQGMLGRIGVDIYLRNPNIVYLTVENGNKEGMSDEERYQELMTHKASRGMIDGEIYRSDDAGASWRKVNADGESIGGGPAYYYGQIIIDPNDADVVHVLSASSWGTRDGGETWLRRPLGFGGDDHALWIDPEDSDHMLLGYDHGLGVTWDGGENWFHPDNQSLAQLYAVGYDMSYPYRVAGGLQDNGSHMGPSTNPAGGAIRFEHWRSVGGGDGMYNEFETCTNRYIYNESQFGPLSRVDLWTGERKGIRYNDPELRWNWNAPILVSPHDCDVVYHAASKLLRSDNMGESWEVISDDLTKADPVTLANGRGGDIQYATITTISESTLQAGLLWVGTDDGNVQVTRDGGANWTLVNDNVPNNPEYWVSRVEASHHDLGTAYISYTGMRRDDFGAYVYKTTDFGESWTDISNNLPEEPVNVIREHHQNPNLLFLGTDFAVYVSVDGGGSWTRMKNNMPTNPVYDLKIHPRENDLIVATHGRGIYIADISALAEVTLETLGQDAFFFQPESKVRWERTETGTFASTNFAGESEPAAIPFYYYLQRGVNGPVTFTVYQGNVVIATVEGSGDAGIQEVSWGMNKVPEATPAQAQQRAGQFGGGRARGQPAPIGEYTVVMSVNGQEMSRTVSILKDDWWMTRR
ncbi:WD40/YVTN/BNR-like repeat-containing protein [Gemmatimonadota bacterium]